MVDTHELWLPESSVPEPTPSTMSALHQFGVEMLKLSRGLGAAEQDGAAGSGVEDTDEDEEVERARPALRMPLPMPGIGLVLRHRCDNFG